MSETVYVARRSCGCIVAAFPLNIDKGVKGELLKQFAKIGLDVDQTSGADVRLNFNLSCTHGAPPLLTMMEKAAAIKWCEVNAKAAIKTVLDKKPFEALAETSNIEFIEKIDTPSITIATDLSEYLLE